MKKTNYSMYSVNDDKTIQPMQQTKKLTWDGLNKVSEKGNEKVGEIKNWAGKAADTLSNPQKITDALSKGMEYLVGHVYADGQAATQGTSNSASSDLGNAGGSGIYEAGIKAESGAQGTDATKVDTPKTYTEWINLQKERAETARQSALKEAEIAKERAMANMQSSYMQNMSTYGVNAENMAQMGLTGSGYSDYLNAQAYAQKRADAQMATAQELTAKTNAENIYQDYIMQLDGKLAEKALYDERLKDERAYNSKQASYNALLGYAMDADSGITEETIRAMAKNAGLSEEEIQNIVNAMNTTKTNAQGEYAKNAFSSIIVDLQNPNAYSNYSEAGIRALGKQWGWTDEQIQQAVDIWSDTKKTADTWIDGSSSEQGQIVMSDIVKAIQDGTLAKADGTPYSSWEEIYETLLRARNDGENITQEDINNAKKAYDRWGAYAEGKVSTDEYYNALNGDEKAQGKLNNAVDPTRYEMEAKSKAVSYGVSEKYLGKVIDTNRDTYKTSEFGDFKGMDDANSEQGKYAQAIVNDAKAGKIKEGQIVSINYGKIAKNHGWYMYVGEGCFVEIGEGGYVEKGAKFPPSVSNLEKITYLPDGYKWIVQDATGNIKKS